MSLFVAPFAGAWIEIERLRAAGHDPEVAPFAGEWIEISRICMLTCRHPSSLRSPERGLKSDIIVMIVEALPRRSVRRSVD